MWLDVTYHIVPGDLVAVSLDVSRPLDSQIYGCGPMPRQHPSPER